MKRYDCGDDLKPCPFCGSTQIRTRRSPSQMECRVCHAEGPSEVCDNEAAGAWNRRASPRVLDDPKSRARPQPQWGPLPDEPPDDGQVFWVRQGPGHIAEAILVCGHGEDDYWLEFDSAIHWEWSEARERYREIAGPIPEPEDSNG